MKKLLLLAVGTALSAYGKAPTGLFTLKNARVEGMSSAIILGAGLAQIVGVKQITSVPEARMATDKVFAAYAELLQHGTEVEYDAEYFYYANTEGMDYSLSSEYLLSLNIEAGLEYFKAALLMATNTEELLALHKDFRDWRNSAEQSAAPLIAEAQQRLSNIETSSDPLEKDRLSVVLADMNWIRKTLSNSKPQHIVPTTGENQPNVETLEERMLHGRPAR